MAYTYFQFRNKNVISFYICISQPVLKIKTKQIKDLDVKTERLKLLGDNREEIFEATGTRKAFLSRTLTAQKTLSMGVYQIK